MYQGSGYKHSDYVGGQNVSFGSKLEKRVLEWLDNSGFAGGGINQHLALTLATATIHQTSSSLYSTRA